MNMHAGVPAAGLDKSYGAFIGGEFLSVGSGSFPAINPATGAHLADIARCGAAEIDLAVKAAQAAFKSWSKTTYEQRSQLLFKLAESLEADLPRLAMIDATRHRPNPVRDHARSPLRHRAISLLCCRDHKLRGFR